jgi:quinol monooxygenase YgiN
MTNVALWVRLEAKPGKEKAVEEFLRGGLSIVEGEPDTITWYAIKMGPSTYGIFDTFQDEKGRQAHLSGEVAKALMQKADELLAKPPDIQKIDVLAAKVPEMEHTH